MKDSSPFRIADFGCGYGGFLRDIVSRGNTWSAKGFDISGEMIARCVAKTADQLPANPALERVSWSVESFLCTSWHQIASMWCFPWMLSCMWEKYHSNVLAEAWRVLRPGGWLVFNDVMARPSAVTEDPSEEPPVLNDVAFPALGSVEHYKRVGEQAGFGSFEYEDFSANIAKHYSSVKTVLADLQKNGGLPADVSSEFVRNMGTSLGRWEECGEKSLQWGVIIMQKTGMPAAEFRVGSPKR